MSKASFKKSSFDLQRLSLPFGWMSVIWLFITSLIFLMPTRLDENQRVTLENFNWTIVVFGIILLIAFIYWNLPAPYGAKHFFTGPKRPEENEVALVPEKKKVRKRPIFNVKQYSP